MNVIVYIILIALYGAFPIPIQLIIFFADILIPDPIPFFDELLLFMVIAAKMSIIEFLDDIGPLGCLIGLVVVVAIIALLLFGLYQLGYNLFPNIILATKYLLC